MMTIVSGDCKKLQFNYNSVPAHENKVLAITQSKSGNLNYVIAYYCHSLHDWASGMNRNVIAWAELPNFPSFVEE